MTHILVVDDSPTIRRMVITSLRGLSAVGFDEAGDGLEAIERLAIHPTDLIILDLNIPNLHGLEVLQFVRGHQRFQSIPVIILTTKGDETSREAADIFGASAYITKPFRPDILLSEVSRLILSEPVS